MSMGAIFLATLVVCGTGLGIGILLGIAGEKFKVEEDEKEIAVRDALPGNNCGGCGYPGCDGLAKAIANGEEEVYACPVGGESVASAIGAIMGMESKAAKKQVAFIKCVGSCEKAKQAYEYVGILDCKIATNNPGGGPKSCSYGCTGFGSCKTACSFGAIQIIEGIAKVLPDKCKACGQCVDECPRNLIALIPYEAKYMVQCNSKDKGKDVKAVCQVGCIGCKICVKHCPEDAITIENNLACIEPGNCKNCGACAEKCPVGVIQKAGV